MPDNTTVNRDFYDLLWTDTRLIRPERFNTWPLIAGLLPGAAKRLEIGPGLRPRLPLSGTNFIDISPPAIKQLLKGGGSAVIGKSTELPFSDGSFGLVCAFDVVEHSPDDRQVFREASRVLKEGGHLIFSVPLYDRFWTKFDEFAGHVRRYEPPALLALLAEHGLTLETSAAYGMQPTSPRLLNLGLWFLTHRRQEAMWLYNRILMPLGMLFQKRLKFVAGLLEAPGVDEIVLVCRKHAPAQPQPQAATY